METKFMKVSVIVMLSMILGACVVAPVQPVGYRTSSAVMPTYVNGQYVGEQPGETVVETTTPVYTYNTYTPYVAPAYVDPWVGFGTGLGLGIGINYFNGCCWGGGYRGGWNRGWNRGWNGGWNRDWNRGWNRGWNRSGWNRGGWNK